MKNDGTKMYEELLLENQLCFPLYVCSKEIVRLYRPFLDELDMTYTQYITMMVLWEEKSISVKELGGKLYLDSGTLTPVLKALESKGYIDRCRCQEDERVLIVTLTDRGAALADKAAEVPKKVACKLSLGPEDAAELYRLLYKVLGSIG